MIRITILAATLVALALSGAALETTARASEHPRVSVTSAEAPSGDSVTVSVQGDAGSEAIGAFTIDLVYDPNVAVARECASDIGVCEPGAAENAARAAGVSISGFRGQIEFFEVTFDVIGPAGSSTDLDVRVVELADVQYVDLVPVTEVTDGAIQVSGASPGDANCDGDIGSTDALLILRQIAGIGGVACPGAADVDCDGGLTSVDALWILRYVALLPVNTPDGCAPIGQAA
jgi:hypothetical protein